jgi:TRAP-type C4-dicarboxylate transport system permease small subunit
MNAKEIMLENLRIVAEAAGFTNPQTLPEIIGAIVGTFLSLIGVIFMILIMYGGFIWMTSGGNEQKVYKAKSILRNSIIGVIIIMSSYAITRWVFEAIQGSL